jgi:hypothetical protein
MNLWFRISTTGMTRTSATNCARLYNLCFKSESEFLGWPFSFMATTELVWDSFVLLSLLEDCQRHLATLILPHTGLQRDWFTAAIRERNVRFRLPVYGQPNIRHYCKKCVRFYNDGQKVSAVVIDGVTIGRPCCYWKQSTLGLRKKSRLGNLLVNYRGPGGRL